MRRSAARRFLVGLSLGGIFVGCGGSSFAVGSGPDAHAEGGADAHAEARAPEASTQHETGPGVVDAGHADVAPPVDATPPMVEAGSCGACPVNYTCGKANGLPVCRAPSGIPLFSNVFVIMMENTSLSTLTPAMTGGTAPNLEALATKYATGDDYHGVDHPSLPNYIALTSGGEQGISCDCAAATDKGMCNGLNCNLLLGSCSCANGAMNIGDQLEAAGITWMDFGESMNTPCNVTDNGNYAVRHNPFLYYTQIQTTARCDAHVVDLVHFDASSPPRFTYIAPNLIDDMHNPDPTNSTNIPDGDKWIGPEVAKLIASSAYTKGGLIVVVWDEDDGSGGITGTDDPVPIFVISPFAKSGGYVSHTKADHYALLATFEDGLGVGRLGKAASASPLVDYFPAM